MTPEQSAALSALNSMGATKKLYRRARRLLGMKGDDLDRLVADAYPPNYSRISMSDAAGMRECPFPGVIVIANNKGGCGKSFLAVNLAAALAKTSRPRGSEKGLNVLLVEQNYANSDIRTRVSTRPGNSRGLVEYVEDARSAGNPDAGGGREAPDLAEYTSPVKGLDNLHVLFISGEESEWRHKGKATTEDLDAVYEAAAGAGGGADPYDIVVVDLQNGLPQAGDLTAETISFWVSVADVMYLVLNPSEAVEHGSEFLDGARRIVERQRQENPDGAPSCSLVPVFNMWRPESVAARRWESGAIALGADYAIAPEEYIPEEYAPRRRRGRPLRACPVALLPPHTGRRRRLRLLSGEAADSAGVAQVQGAVSTAGYRRPDPHKEQQPRLLRRLRGATAPRRPTVGGRRPCYPRPYRGAHHRTGTGGISWRNGWPIESARAGAKTRVHRGVVHREAVHRNSRRPESRLRRPEIRMLPRRWRITPRGPLGPG